MPKKSSDVAEEGHVQALFEFGYDAERPRVERGEVFMPGGHEHDSKLLSLRYVALVRPGTELKQCGECGKLFVNDSTRTAHGDTWHSFVCECGWVAPAGSKSARSRALEAHREKCDVMREVRSERRESHLREVKELKAPTPATVG